MINTDNLKPEVLDDIREFLGHEDASLDRKGEILVEIQHMSPEEAMDAYLSYNGIIGYTSQILSAWRSINEAVIASRTS